MHVSAPAGDCSGTAMLPPQVLRGARGFFGSGVAVQVTLSIVLSSALAATGSLPFSR